VTGMGGPVGWQIEFTVDTDLGPTAIWGALRDIETGVVPMGSGDLRETTGPFEVGTVLRSTPVGIDTLESTITELEPGRLLAIRTNFNGLVLLLRHVLDPLDGAGTRITRRLEISGPAADRQGPVAGPRISADYPQALDELVAVARRQV
jgi:hypothetical protein